MKKNNITLIEDLIDLDSYNPNSQRKVNFIDDTNDERNSFMNQIQTKNIRKNSDYHIAMNGGNSDMAELYNNQMMQSQMQSQMQMQPQMQSQMQPMQMYTPIHTKIEDDDITCIMVANHIKDCPICSKFYNNDNSVYIVCIVLLAIICIILLKRILETKS